MKGSIIPILVLSLFSTAALAAGDGSDPEPSAQVEGVPEVGPGAGDAAPMTEHQGQAVESREQQFASLDRDRDGRISHEEAQQDPALAAYWKAEDLGPNDLLDRAEFARFQAREQTGTDFYKEDKDNEEPGELPASPHQKNVIEEGGSGAPEDGAER